MPCIAGYGVKKLMSRTPINCAEYLATVSYRRNMTNDNKLFMEHNMSCLDLRDKGGLIWLSKLIVIVHGIMKIIFE